MPAGSGLQEPYIFEWQEMHISGLAGAGGADKNRGDGHKGGEDYEAGEEMMKRNICRFMRIFITGVIFMTVSMDLTGCVDNRQEYEEQACRLLEE